MPEPSYLVHVVTTTTTIRLEPRGEVDQPLLQHMRQRLREEGPFEFTRGSRAVIVNQTVSTDTQVLTERPACDPVD